MSEETIGAKATEPPTPPWEGFEARELRALASLCEAMDAVDRTGFNAEGLDDIGLSIDGALTIYRGEASPPHGLVEHVDVDGSLAVVGWIVGDDFTWTFVPARPVLHLLNGRWVDLPAVRAYNVGERARAAAEAKEGEDDEA